MIMVFLVAGFGVAISRPAAAEQTFMDHCLDSYLQKKECPADICQLRCIHDTPDCVKMCLPKECPKIDVAHCPGKYCEVMTDCSDQKICHYQMMGEKPECGDLAYAGQDVECCDGFVKRCGVEFLDGRCDMEGKNSVYNIPICIPCGDGICGQFEDRCNCPEDCKSQLKEPPKLIIPPGVVKQDNVRQPAKNMTEPFSEMKENAEPAPPKWKIIEIHKK